MKGFRGKFLYLVHSMSVLGKESKSLFYIEYSIFTHVFVL